MHPKKLNTGMKNNQSIHNEDEKLSPLLESLKDQQSFRVPDDYFEELPGVIQSQIQQLPDFEKSAVVNPFSVPEGYFEQLPLAISNAIEEQKNPVFSLRTFFAILLRPRVTVAFASLLLIFFFSIRFFTREISVSAPATEFSMQDLDNSRVLDELDESTLMDLLAEQNQDISADDQNENIEEYLIDNDIDISQLESRL